MAQKRMTSGRLRAIGGAAWSLFFVVFTGPAIAGVEEAARLSEQSGGVAMVVMRGGAVAFEDYADGAGADTAVQLASGTKSFAGVIAAAAVKDGLLALDERVAETLTEWDGDLEKETITIRQLLALTSGVDTPAPGDIPTYSEAIARPMKTAPGAAFAYGPVNFQIFGEVIRRKLLRHGDGAYKDGADYLRARVLDPIGVTVSDWRRGDDGYHILSAGAIMTARQWARFGQFVLNEGAWNGAQLVDRRTLLETRAGSAANAAYGLSWWLNKTPSAETLAASKTMQRATDLYTNKNPSLPDTIIMAAGYGKQRLYIIPSHDMVVVRLTQGVDLNRLDRGRANRSAQKPRRGFSRKDRRQRRQTLERLRTEQKFSDTDFLTALLTD